MMYIEAKRFGIYLPIILAIILSSCQPEANSSPKSPESCQGNNTLDGYTVETSEVLPGEIFPRVFVVPKNIEPHTPGCIALDQILLPEANAMVINFRGDLKEDPVNLIFGSLPAHTTLTPIQASTGLDWASIGFPVSVTVGAPGSEGQIPMSLVRALGHKQILLKLNPDNTQVDFGYGFGTVPVTDFMKIVSTRLTDKLGSKVPLVTTLYTASLIPTPEDAEKYAYLIPTPTPEPPTPQITVTLAPPPESTSPPVVVESGGQPEQLVEAKPKIEHIAMPETSGRVTLTITMLPDDKPRRITHFDIDHQPGQEASTKLFVLLHNPYSNPKAIIEFLKNQKNTSIWRQLINPHISPEKQIWGTVNFAQTKDQIILSDPFVLELEREVWVFGIDAKTGALSYLKLEDSDLTDPRLSFTTGLADGSKPDNRVVSNNLRHLLTTFRTLDHNYIVDGQDRRGGFFNVPTSLITSLQRLTFEEIADYFSTAPESHAVQPIYIVNTQNGALIPINFPIGSYFEKGHIITNKGKTYVVGRFNLNRSFPESVDPDTVLRIYQAGFDNQSDLFAIPIDNIAPVYLPPEEDTAVPTPTPLSTQIDTSFLNEDPSDRLYPLHETVSKPKLSLAQRKARNDSALAIFQKRAQRKLRFA